MNNSGLAKKPEWVHNQTVLPEDRALQGCNPSAEENSNTAGLGGGDLARAGHLRDRLQSEKSQGVWGTESPICDAPLTINKRRSMCVSIFPIPAFHAEPVQLVVFTLSCSGWCHS